MHIQIQRTRGAGPTKSLDQRHRSGLRGLPGKPCFSYQVAERALYTTPSTRPISSGRLANS
ncbi:MAG: hypothetical protein GY896_03415 [Gammaproteobacteria bacterium]|nr:hypothetical protein [Gammaproteobacteria bacterium]